MARSIVEGCTERFWGGKYVGVGGFTTTKFRFDISSNNIFPA